MFVQCVKKNQLAKYILSFSQTQMFEKYFEAFNKHKIEPDPHWGGITQKSEQGKKNQSKGTSVVTVILRIENRTQGHFTPGLRCKWERLHVPFQHNCLGTWICYSIYMLGNNTNIMEIFHLLMLVSSSGNRWTPKLEPNWTEPQKNTPHTHTHTHTHTHQAPQSISLPSHVMSSTYPHL